MLPHTTMKPVLALILFQLFSPATSRLSAAPIHALDFDWMRDPHILRHGGSYYLTPTRLEHIDLGVPGIELWKSDNLTDWQHLGVPWDIDYSSWLKPASTDTGSTPHIIAPELYFLDGRWVAVHSTPNGNANLLSGTGEYNEGFHEPFAATLGKRPHPSIFTDRDRSRWLVWSPATIQKIDPTLSRLEGTPVPLLPAGQSPPTSPCTIARISDRYVLFTSAWSTGTPEQGTYNLYFSTAKKPAGPYTTPRFAARFCGGGTPFQDKSGQWWTSASQSGIHEPDPAGGQTLADNKKPWTINPRGLTLVPLTVKTTPANDTQIRATPAPYNTPGPEESRASSEPVGE